MELAKGKIDRTLSLSASGAVGSYPSHESDRHRRTRIAVGCHADHVDMIVRNNGRGCNPDDVLRDINRNACFGLMSVRERVRLLRGRLSIQSRPGERMTICVHVRLRGESHEQDTRPDRG